MQFHLFCWRISSFPLHLLKHNCFPIKWSWYPRQKSVDHKYVDLSLDSQVCSIDLYVCSHGIITMSCLLCCFLVIYEIGKCESSILCFFFEGYFAYHEFLASPYECCFLLSNYMLFIFFFYPIILARTCSTMLNRSDENEPPSLFMDLNRNTSTLSLLCMLIVGLIFFLTNLLEG